MLHPAVPRQTTFGVSMERSATLHFRVATGLALLAAICVGCGSGDLGTDVPHKPHSLEDSKKKGAADMDLLPAPPGMKTGTIK
jgi:hypothetical protein